MQKQVPHTPFLGKRVEQKRVTLPNLFQSWQAKQVWMLGFLQSRYGTYLIVFLERGAHPLFYKVGKQSIAG